MKELQVHKHIINACRAVGGEGRKWVSEYGKGYPDLILSTPTLGLFLAEVKVYPVWPHDGTRALSATSLAQSKVLMDYKKGGALVCVLAVFGTRLPNSRLVWYNDPDLKYHRLLHTNSVEYMLPNRFDIDLAYRLAYTPTMDDAKLAYRKDKGTNGQSED